MKFISNVKEMGVKYAVIWLFNLPYLFEESKIPALRRFSDRCYDYAYEADCNAMLMEEALDDNEGPAETTPCGCTSFACWECGSYPVCQEQM